MAALIERGLSADHILDAGEAMGLERPHMEDTLLELESGLPHILALADYLAELYGDKRLLFLARDAELMADAYAITHPDKQSQLLPGSIRLWEWIRDTQSPLAPEFFARYNLSLYDEPSSVLIDTGFQGTAGYWIWTALDTRNVYRSGDPAEIKALASHMPIKLISAIGQPQLRWGEQIVDFNSDDILQGHTMFPKVQSVIRPYFEGERDYYSRDPLAYRLAMSLQIMPHFHGAFERLERTDQGVVAVPREEAIRSDIDHISRSDEGEGRNASIVNPLAALVVQHRVIQASMARH